MTELVAHPDAVAAVRAMAVPLVFLTSAPAIDEPRPLVAVVHPVIPAAWREGVPTDEATTEPVLEALVLTCSVCGDLTDWEDLPRRQDLQRRARRHAEEAHDGDVDAEGWAR